MAMLHVGWANFIIRLPNSLYDVCVCGAGRGCAAFTVSALVNGIAHNIRDDILDAERNVVYMHYDDGTSTQHIALQRKANKWNQYQFPMLVYRWFSSTFYICARCVSVYVGCTLSEMLSLKLKTGSICRAIVVTAVRNSGLWHQTHTHIQSMLFRKWIFDEQPRKMINKMK